MIPPYPSSSSKNDDGPGFADYIVTALSPVLIMGLVGSLVFFLAEILYSGRYDSNLRYTLFFYVVGIVLVSRVSIAVDPGRSAMYGVVLSGACLLALTKFVNYPSDSWAGRLAPLINMFLMAVVWWSAHKLTKDCTHIDERRESADRGLLSAVGFERKHLEEPEEVEEVDPEKPAAKLGWWDRYQEYRKKKELKPHTPGTTIIYFSMAALPIFGLGQSLVPSGDAARRSYTFELAAVYVGSALGLLLTTSFLGVRRYLRQRNLSMPKSMTGVWLGVGAAFIVGFIIVAALLPRPYSETPLFKTDFFKSTDRSASRNAVNRDGAGKGDGKPGNQTKAGDGQRNTKNGQPGGQGKNGESKQGSGDKDGKNGSSSDQSKQSNDQAGNGKDNENKDSQEKQENGPNAAQQSNRGNQQGKQPGDKSKSSDSQSSQLNADADSAKRFESSSLGKFVELMATGIKWLVFAAIAILVIFVLVYIFLRKLAPFTDWARNLLGAIQAFLARFQRSDSQVEQPQEKEEVLEPRITFDQFSNPFEDGTARSKTSADLIHYSFAAMEAWAGDRDAERQRNETPLEFASRIQEAYPQISPQAERLAVLLVRLEYADGNLPSNAKEALRQVWEHLSNRGQG